MLLSKDFKMIKHTCTDPPMVNDKAHTRRDIHESYEARTHTHTHTHARTHARARTHAHTHTLYIILHALAQELLSLTGSKVIII